METMNISSLAYWVWLNDEHQKCSKTARTSTADIHVATDKDLFLSPYKTLSKEP